MTTSNLAARTSWHAVFTVLGHDGPKAVPGPARCPLCQAPELFIYQDTTLEGGWCYCSRCLFSGDALDLAAAAWHCPRQEAVWKIISDTNAAQLQADAEHPRRKAKTFWDQASAYAPQSGTVLSHSSMSLNLTDVPRGEWLQRGGRYLGVATRALMTSWLSPYRVNRLFPRESRPRQLPWNEAAVLPFYDLPGRLSAFLLHITDAQSACTFYMTIGPRSHTAAGVLGLDTPLTLSQKIMVLLDPFLAVLLHVKHLRESDDPLPVLGIWPQAPATPYLQRFGDQLVFWAKDGDADLFRHAWSSRSMISLAAASEPRQQLRQHTPASWVWQQDRRAQPCGQALEDRLEELTRHQVETLLGQIGLPAAQLRQLIDDCSDRLQRKLAELPILQSQSPSLVGSRKIVATSEGWCLEKTGELVAGCTFRIDRMIVDSGQTRYEGIVFFGGQELSFTAPEASFSKGPLKWLRRFLLAGGHGAMAYSPYWQSHIFNLALQAYPPQTVRIRPYGWDNQEACWVLPDCVIELGGEIKPSSGLIDDNFPTRVADDSKHIDPSSGLTDDLYSVLVPFLYNVLAPAYRYPPIGVLLTGPSSPAMAQLVQSLSPEPSSGSPTTIDLSSRWPYLIPSSESNLRALDHHRGLPMSFMEVDWWRARLLPLRSKWLVIQGPDVFEPSSGFTDAQALVRAFLAWLSRRQMRRISSQKDPWLALQEDLQAWYRELKPSQGLSLRHGLDVLADLYIDVAGRLFDEGALRLEWLQHRQPNSSVLRTSRASWPIIYDHDERSIWIAPAYVNQALLRRGLPGVDVNTVRAELIEAKRLIGEREHDHQPGFVIDEDWWTMRLKFSRPGRQTALRLAEGTR